MIPGMLISCVDEMSAKQEVSNRIIVVTAVSMCEFRLQRVAVPHFNHNSFLFGNAVYTCNLSNRAV
jgi:hypothetical protein